MKGNFNRRMISLFGNYNDMKTSESNFSTFAETPINSNLNKRYFSGDKRIIDDFENSLSFNRNTDYRNNLLNTSSGFLYKPNSNKKIRKTINFFTNENQVTKRFPSEFLSKENERKKVKFEKLIPSSTILENYRKNVKDDLSLFKDYKPIKRYYISDLKRIPSLYDTKGLFLNQRKTLNPLNKYQQLKLNENNDINMFRVFH